MSKPAGEKVDPRLLNSMHEQSGRVIQEDSTVINWADIMERVALNTGYQDYFEAIAQGIIPDKSFIYKFGRTQTVIGKRVPIWDLGGYYTFPDTDALVTITSNSVDDNPTGIGARSVHIFGLGPNFEMVDEIVSMGGTTVNTYRRVFRMHVEESGLSEFPYDNTYTGNNIGLVLATHAATGLPVAAIQPRNGQTLMSIFTVPAGYSGYIWDANTVIGKGQDATGFLFTRLNNGITNPWLTKGIRDMYQNQVGNQFKIPTKYPEKTDIVFAVEGTQNGNNVSGTFLLELIKNEV